MRAYVRYDAGMATRAFFIKFSDTDYKVSATLSGDYSVVYHIGNKTTSSVSVWVDAETDVDLIVIGY